MINKITIVILGIIERILNATFINVLVFLAGLVVGIGCMTFIIKTSYCKYTSEKDLLLFERLDHVTDELMKIRDETKHNLIYHCIDGNDITLTNRISK